MGLSPSPDIQEFLMNEPSRDDQVSLIIPQRNAAGTIEACLDAAVALLGKDGLDEIIVVDDGSTDDTAQIVGRYVERYPVTPISSGEKGPGGARNVGWRAARNPLVWFVDSDCIIEPNALELLLPAMADEKVGGVGGSYSNMRPDSLLACLIHEEIVARHLVMPEKVNCLATFNVIYRREVLEQVGGFDEGNVNAPGSPGAEDIELAYRVCRAGHELRFDRRSLVGHYHPTSLRRYLRSQRHHGYWRVRLYTLHPNRAGGDVYSGFLDHIQPPLAMLILVALFSSLFATLMTSQWMPPRQLYSPWLIWSMVWSVPAVGSLLLLLAQVPITLRLVRRLGQWRYLAFAPMSFLRAFARGIGLTLGVLRAFLPNR
jgi:glycosyltransferase involved in cell wall biosynthesis